MLNIYSIDTVRKMPSASLDSDVKYQKLIQTNQDLCSSKNKNDSNNNNNSHNKSNCKLFDNILESLIWLTENKDKNLLAQISHKNELVYTKERQKTNVLITGSLYLVGLALKVLNYKTD